MFRNIIFKLNSNSNSLKKINLFQFQFSIYGINHLKSKAITNIILYIFDHEQNATYNYREDINVAFPLPKSLICSIFV